MKRLLPVLLLLALLATPLCWAKSHRSDDTANASNATGSSNQDPVALPADSSGAGQNAGSAAADPGPPADVNKTLDDVLSKPIDTLVKEAPPTEPVLQGKAQVDANAAPNPAGQNAQNASVDGLQALHPNAGAPILKGEASIGTLAGQANQEDPDVGNEQLQVEWDRWRNRFLRAVQMQIQASVNNPDPDMMMRRRVDPMTGMVLPRFPMGTVAWFDCEITNDGRIARLAITQSSGFQAYDRAVVEGIRALEGTSLLTFPRASRRLSVRQEAGIQTAAQSNYRYFNFGDVERYNTPQGSN